MRIQKEPVGSESGGRSPAYRWEAFRENSELADRLVRWIAAGAKDDPNAGKDAPKLQAVDLYPPQRSLRANRLPSSWWRLLDSQMVLIEM